MSYLKTIPTGHQYKLKLFPDSCDLDETIVQTNLKISNESLKDFPSYSFKIIKKKNNIYTINLILSGSILETKHVNVELSYLNDSLNVPKKFVAAPVLHNIAEYSDAAQVTLLGLMGASFFGTLALGATSMLWSIISFQQFVGYFIYINVEYPYQVNLFLSLFQSISWNILPNPLASLTSRWSKDILGEDDDLMQKYKPPQKFVDHEVSSFFIENSGTIIVVNIGLFMSLVMINLLRMNRYLKSNQILKTITVSIRWNIIARTFLENGIPLALGTFLQIRYFTFENVHLAICGIFTVLAAINLIAMILFLMVVLKENTNSVLDSKKMRQIYGTLFEGMTLAQTYGKYYHMIILFRGVFLMALLVFCEDMSLAQSTIMIYYNLGLVYFLFTKAEFKEMTLNRINRMKEILILIGEICILFMQFHVTYEEYYNALGWLVVGSLSLALIIELLYMLIVQLMQIKKIFGRVFALFQSIPRRLSKKPKIKIRLSRSPLRRS